MRGDLPTGLAAAQAVHAAFDFAADHPEVVQPWHTESNWLVIVSVPDEDALYELCTDAKRVGLPYTLVTEPDIGDQATAVALAPGEIARRLCSSMPLFAKEVALV